MIQTKHPTETAFRQVRCKVAIPCRQQSVLTAPTCKIKILTISMISIWLSESLQTVDCIYPKATVDDILQPLTFSSLQQITRPQQSTVPSENSWYCISFPIYPSYLIHLLYCTVLSRHKCSGLINRSEHTKLPRQSKHWSFLNELTSGDLPWSWLWKMSSRLPACLDSPPSVQVHVQPPLSLQQSSPGRRKVRRNKRMIET